MIIFLHGPDTFRAKRKLKELKVKFRREIDRTGIELVEIEGEKTSLGQINGLIRPASLFSKKRMAVIEDIFLNKSPDLAGELLKILIKEEKGDNIIIFLDQVSANEKLSGDKKELFKFLAGQKFSMAFPLLGREEQTRWIKAEAAAGKAELSAQAAGLLASLSENLWQAHNELQKLIAYKKALADAPRAKGNKTASRVLIAEEDVYRLVQGKLDTNIFSLTDAIGAGKKALALKLFSQQLESGAAETYLISMILRQFKIILRLRQALDLGENQAQIASSLKLHPFIVRQGIGQARLFSLPVLKEIIRRLIRMDYDLKTGRGDIKTNLSLLIAGLK